MIATCFGGPLDGGTYDATGARLVVAWQCCIYGDIHEVVYELDQIMEGGDLIARTSWIQPECTHR